LDKKTLTDSVKKTHHCVVVTEAPEEGGWSGEAAAVIAEACFGELKKPVKRVCGMRTGIPYPTQLEKAAVPDESWIVKAVEEVLG
jgi:pyruvate/2-oxoglutarate/acetoin dehydrogenase E1 component